LAFVNIKNKEVQLKIVYYGPGRGGKTTNLEYINANYQDQIASEMISLKTEGDRTLYFDFLPFDIGKIEGYDVKIRLYTVPGQTKYNATRKLVLNGADGVVFVADAQVEQRKQNIESLNNLYQNLKEYNRDLFSIPLVLQYNKMDLQDEGVPLMPTEMMQKELNSRLKAPAFAASAIKGLNVAATLKKIISMTIAASKNELF